ncbi:hypothetical protein [Nostoc foliaceum]|uniref:Uncharacterized protein n=3 Tax=Nostoc TaxID=1177 RepID=A0ABR8IFK0_9NOSO|nr:hypothetical protein [Nostoc foliaceum]MBD2563874.1 hypothetical protein [Nostoc linckia FACHB-391]MBD2649948.1 hypothetical protein [Nostoc foliaceum FACHB-393]
MTYQIYSQQQLHLKSIARLKEIYSEIGCTVEVSDKRCKDAWISAIVNYQASKVQKLTPATSDNQALAQAELDNYIADQAQVVAPEPLRIVEISFDHHEYYADDKLVASISNDDNHLTQRWVVMVNDKEVFRANTLMRCDRFICTHYKDGSLPVQEQLATPPTTENQIMAHIFNECQNYGFEILDDGIYTHDTEDGKLRKLGQVGCTNGNWWVIQDSSGQQQYSNSVYDAVRSLSMADTSFATEPIPEYLQHRPLQQLTTDELQQLLNAEVANCEQLLDRPVDELTSQDWEWLREYEPYLELVAA